MKNKLEEIRKPVGRDMERYEAYVRQALHSDDPSISQIVRYIFDNQGKGLRPLLVMLSATLHANGQPLGERSHVAAMLIEMIHTASLVHDDVVDEAYIRRSKPSLKALWRSKTSVLIGDYILSKGFLAGMESGHLDIVLFISRSMSTLCEGELIQTRQSDRLRMTREIYFDIIRKKTATLIGASSGSGALSAGATADEVARMQRFGDSLGIAFQIKDDILDYAPDSRIGKPVCGDLRERKVTLPLLTVLEQSPPLRQKYLLGKLADVRRNPSNADYLREVVVAENGLVMAAEEMNRYLDEARAILGHYPDSPARRSLSDLCDFVTARTK